MVFDQGVGNIGAASQKALILGWQVIVLGPRLSDGGGGGGHLDWLLGRLAERFQDAYEFVGSIRLSAVV
ncbi:uncharacterized protein ColSpa_06372 [Colletotrichum spaethianum]|uniref:Uncharacterized protein n=1 Tax=Colletotrichum spaethianum TaxID=700344 RepID=A0AA37P6E2_9PEZI|nr:uncharacterized protein ColSpa_06372 [Colletotrichum spaethianum]GKT46191.1 hypothetical protein ColSpa_06372 [Colletotrichum spaethianum]